MFRNPFIVFAQALNSNNPQTMFSVEIVVVFVVDFVDVSWFNSTPLSLRMSAMRVSLYNYKNTDTMLSNPILL